MKMDATVRAVLTAFLLLALPLPVMSQGTVSGVVVDRQTAATLASAQVFIQDLDIGVLSQANGRYVLENVPAGTYTVSAQRIGYQTITQEALVQAGETVVVDFDLIQQALGLDEIIVTGTAGGTQRRAIGNVVSQLDAGGLMTARAGAITTIEQMLSDRVPGLAFIGAPGGAGQAAAIRLRRSSSVAIPADPIIYIDGIRMQSDRREVGRTTAISGLNDIDPRDIESIEIIKGPAAATLYGTEAANGVIQIITKRGVEGQATFDASMELGGMWLPHNDLPTIWAPDPAKCAAAPCPNLSDLVSMNLVDLERDLGNPDVFRIGETRSYHLSIRGGSELFRYYASVNRDANQGVVRWNNDKRNAVRTSLSVTPYESLTLTINGSYHIGRHSSPGGFWASNFAYGGVPLGALTGSPARGFRNPPESYYSDTRFDITESTRSTYSVEALFQPVDWLTSRFIAGYDKYDGENVNQTIKDAPESQWTSRCGRIGCRALELIEAPVTTLDVSSTASFQLTDALSSETSSGLQYYHTETNTIRAYGEGFATGSLRTVGAAAIALASGSRGAPGEETVENTTLGVYVQQRVGWNDRLFLTAAVRFDDNSAFGTDFGGATYPKFSGTWVVHEEPFWDIDFISQLRLRGAWGAAGQQPDAFAATRLFTPETGPGQLPILVPSSFGNADLGPERGEELELGFDTSFLNDRISFGFTRFWRTTKDALITQTVAPSFGIPGAVGSLTGPVRLVNIGEIRAWGTESELYVQALTQDPLRWDLSLSVTTGGNRIEDMGGSGRIQVQRGRAHEEGYALASIIDWKIRSADFVSGDRGPVTNLMCDAGTGFRGLNQGGATVPCDEAVKVYWGLTEPRWLVSLGSTFTVFEDWILSTTVAGMGGHWMSSDYLGARHQSFVSSELFYLQDNAIGMGYLNLSRSGLTYHKAGFVKLREVSLGYNVPDALAERLGASSARISVGLRNAATLYLRMECPLEEPRVCASDPEMNRPGEDFWGEPAGSWPPNKQATLALSVSF